jgi:ArsR family transcriptional regulator
MKDLVKIFKALADPTRLRIIALLLKRELCVCELMFILKMEQSRISHQLRILRDAELVKDRRDGRWIIYRIPDESRRELKLLLEKLLAERLEKEKQITTDLKALELCTDQEIRKRQFSGSWTRRKP